MTETHEPGAGLSRKAGRQEYYNRLKYNTVMCVCVCVCDKEIKETDRQRSSIEVKHLCLVSEVRDFLCWRKMYLQ